MISRRGKAVRRTPNLTVQNREASARRLSARKLLAARRVSLAAASAVLLMSCASDSARSRGETFGIDGVGSFDPSDDAPLDTASADEQSQATAPSTSAPATTSPPATDAFTVDPAKATGGVDGPVIYMRNNADAQTALATGTLKMVNGCLGLGIAHNEDDSSFVPLIWVYGTGWNPSDSTVMFSGSKVRIGEQVELGGGFNSRDRLDHFITDPIALEHIDRCLDDLGTDEVFINQSASR